ncbi:hypothetical protein [Paracidobacterium acidisoli]|uniref:hypothetical protein n=1 Tax=Paracidobacterium acidisoli TaxID=2303751 RepID=UPI0018F183AB|nr:hypothetical protein [Paracidobacterium acidisoli]MBT9333385.1 hypothetical protein [Paracidobacterium acidisoli]
MNISQAWVELALRTLSCNQKALAQRVAVSPAQISKWKNGEYMSSDMERKFRAIVKLGDEQHPEFVLWAGSPEDAAKWDELIHRLAENARESAETGYDTEPLADDMGLLSLFVSSTLVDMGIEPPKVFPSELDPYLNSDDEDDKEVEAVGEDAEEIVFETDDALWDLLNTNPYSKVISDIFDSLNDVYGFYAAYVSGLTHKLMDDGEPGESVLDLDGNIESGLIDLAACKIEVDEKFAPKIKMFRSRIIKSYVRWLTTLKDAAFHAGVPLGAELMDMVDKDAGELGHTAEAESLGFNAARLHPDIYMNELLVGMRTIHQVLPAILKKLEINDLELDGSDLYLDTRARHGALFNTDEQSDEEE